MRRGTTTSPLERVTAVPDNDPEMDAAIQKARETLPSFVVALQTPTTGDRHLLVKARFVEGENSEHMWVADLIAEGNTFRGVLADEPKFIKNLRFKQPIIVSRDQISDWMIVQDGKVKGAFTTRVLRSKLNPEKQRAFDQSLPYQFE